MKEKTKSPWPTKAVMNQIYDKHLWGGNDVDFYSGDGSHNPKIIQPYLDAVISFLKSHHNNLIVCDLGCGDFNVGKHLFEYTKKYIAIDIVESLINRNKTRFKTNHLEFLCLDIAKDEFPKADCIILRQVLQHLSNTEIKSIIEKLSGYKYIIITEHLPIGSFIANKNKIASQGIRLKQHSGVDILASPFNLKVTHTQVLNEVVLDNTKGRIMTALYKM